jgi:nicotinate-nucleotide adenylyltransferase
MSAAPGERLGILGGTFDPPHLGHVTAAVAARAQLKLDRVLFVVANDPWQKSPVRDISPAADRLALVLAAIEGVDGAEVSRIELDRGGPSYTVETVEELAALAIAGGREPPEQFLIVGADVVDTLSTWHRAQDLARLVTLVVVARPGARPPDEVGPWRVEYVPGTSVDVSSSEVRELVARGEPIAGLVPESVERCIRRRALYAVPR